MPEVMRVDELWKAFVADLRTISELIEFVGDRIFGTRVSKDQTEMYLVYGLISERPKPYVADHIKGRQHMSDMTIQINVWEMTERSTIQVTRARDIISNAYENKVLRVAGIGVYVINYQNSRLMEEGRYSGYVCECKVVFRQE
jgi:hypothetical protein